MTPPERAEILIKKLTKMTKQEIKSIIDGTISGQGSQVDIGGALPTILSSLAERMSGEVDVTVKVHSYKKSKDSFEPDTEVSGSLYIKGFDAFGNVIPEQEIPFNGTADMETIDLSFKAHQGDTIAVLAKIPGKGASCQLVTKVVADCTVEPEVYPVGIYELGDGALSITPGEYMYNGTVIVTEDFAILWPKYQREGFEDNKQWGPLFQIIPVVLVSKDINAAIKDFDGALNTAAILSVISGDSAAKIASVPTPQSQFNATGFFLPSLGILKYLYDHKAEINAFIQAETNAYSPDVDYQLIPDLYVWSSTLGDSAVRAWYLDSRKGDLYRGYRDIISRVCAVSAFRTLN